MKVIGLTGGVGSGKTIVARMLQEECGAILLITDELGHKVMEPGQEGYEKIRNHFGEKILAEDGQIDRAALAEIIFQKEEERQALNHIIHPQVIRYVEEFIENKKGEEGVIVLESALLYESGCHALCDSVWYVHVSERCREKRLIENRHYSKEKIAGIMEKQLEEKEFLDRSDVVIENDGTMEQLREAVRAGLKTF
jgi:dephospho-CoA kinase